MCVLMRVMFLSVYAFACESNLNVFNSWLKEQTFWQHKNVYKKVPFYIIMHKVDMIYQDGGQKISQA